MTRKWLEQAKQQGQVVNNTAPDGTYAAGVNRVTELMPVLMNDITSSAPADQKVRMEPSSTAGQRPARLFSRRWGHDCSVDGALLEVASNERDLAR